MMVKAYTNQDIAKELGITIRMVKAHTGSIYQKLGVNNRMQCVKKVNLFSDTTCG